MGDRKEPRPFLGDQVKPAPPPAPPPPRSTAPADVAAQVLREVDETHLNDPGPKGLCWALEGPVGAHCLYGEHHAGKHSWESLPAPEAALRQHALPWSERQIARANAVLNEALPPVTSRDQCLDWLYYDGLNDTTRLPAIAAALHVLRTAP